MITGTPEGSTKVELDTSLYLPDSTPGAGRPAHPGLRRRQAVAGRRGPHLRRARLRRAHLQRPRVRPVRRPDPLRLARLRGPRRHAAGRLPRRAAAGAQEGRQAADRRGRLVLRRRPVAADRRGRPPRGRGRGRHHLERPLARAVPQLRRHRPRACSRSCGPATCSATRSRPRPPSCSREPAPPAAEPRRRRRRPRRELRPLRPRRLRGLPGLGRRRHAERRDAPADAPGQPGHRHRPDRRARRC